jgi:hypothetical protein
MVAGLFLQDYETLHSWMALFASGHLSTLPHVIMLFISNTNVCGISVSREHSQLSVQGVCTWYPQHMK